IAGENAFFLAGLSMVILKMRSCVSVRIFPSALMVFPPGVFCHGVAIARDGYRSYFTASAVRIAAVRSGEKCEAPCSSRSRNDSTPPREPQLPSSMMRKLIHQAGEGAFIPQAS